jgi:hypothetical protein
MTCIPTQGQGVWKTAQIVSQTTTTLVEARPGDAIVVTDVLVSGKKVNNATLSLQFSDGAVTEIFMAPDMNNAPVNLSYSPNGLIRGWINSDVQAVTAGANPVLTVLIGYYHVSGFGAKSFAAWDALR